MKRRLDGVFHLSNSHTVLHLEKARVMMEVIDSDREGMCLFVISDAEYTYDNYQSNDVFVAVSMDAWRIMSEMSKRMTNKKRNLVLRLEIDAAEASETRYKFGVVNLETSEYSYLLEERRFPLSIYRCNSLLEPSRFTTRATLFCPMEFDRICKETCAFHDVLKMAVRDGVAALEFWTDKQTNISFSIPVAKHLLQLDYHHHQQQPEQQTVYNLPLRILRVITRFCTRADKIVIYLGRPVTFVAKRKKKIIWTLRLK